MLYQKVSMFVVDADLILQSRLTVNAGACLRMLSEEVPKDGRHSQRARGGDPQPPLRVLCGAERFIEQLD